MIDIPPKLAPGEWDRMTTAEREAYHQRCLEAKRALDAEHLKDMHRRPSHSDRHQPRRPA